MAVKFANLGARLVLWDIDTNGNTETARQVKATGATVRAYTVDLSNREAVYATADQVSVTESSYGETAGRPWLN